MTCSGRQRGRACPLIAAALAAVTTGVTGHAEPAPLKVPQVPFVGQSRALCGGAALAMVMRYWRPVDVVAEDFAAFVDHAAGGIPTGELARLAESVGFRAFPMAASAKEAEQHLAGGRPLIALLSTGRRAGHYVVLLASAGERVLYHDPAAGPFRVMRLDEWREQWSRSGNWALLLLPADDPPRSDERRDGVSEADDPCDPFVLPAIATARAGDLDAAALQLARAAARCPGSSRPWREMAGIHFLREDWGSAARSAERAVEVDPADTRAWRLLATSRFLEGRPDAALEAWNEVGEPRLDLVEVEGLRLLGFREVMTRVGMRHGDVVTAGALRRARRRMANLPGAAASRVGYRPQPGGRADLTVAVAEAPRITSARAVLLRSGALALSRGSLGAEIGVVAAPHALQASARWQPNRSRFRLAADHSNLLGTPGTLLTEVIWDSQTYLVEDRSTVGERRRVLQAELAEWWSDDLWVAVALAADRWQGRDHARASVRAERRLLDDHAAVSARWASWWAPAERPVHGSSVALRVRTGDSANRPSVAARVYWHRVGRGAPRALWAGAGTGHGRPELLRGHTLVRDGVIDATGSAPFAPSLLGSSIEGEMPIARLGPLRLRAAVFLDTAHAPAARRRDYVDVGAGLRVGLPGERGAVRIDLATPTDRARFRLSAGWQVGWDDPR